tara:strand:+ start:54 stop:1109 length:1056 start_codon:yes stop_codon:yes gene_type:complete
MSRWRRTVPALLFLLFMSMPLVYFQLGNLVYTQAAATNLECSGHSARNSPDDFSVKLWNEDIEEAMFEKNETLAGNLSHLWFDAWENDTIDIPGEDISLAAWVMESNASRPWVIMVHGIRSCKANHEMLIPAAWLYQADFNVVIFDLRDHGNSTVEDGLVSAGQREWRDVVAVWNWLQDERGVEASSIGLYGTSLGAGTAAIAFDLERDIQALFLESSFSSMDKILKEELEFAGFPVFLKDAAVFAGKVSSGDNLVKYEPLSAAENIGNRSMFITQSEEDVRIKIHHSHTLCDAARENVEDGGLVECWFDRSSIAHEDEGVPGILSHATLMLTQPDEYRNRLVSFFEASLE